jgi:hypothetical protein
VIDDAWIVTRRVGIAHRLSLQAKRGNPVADHAPRPPRDRFVSGPPRVARGFGSPRLSAVLVMATIASDFMPPTAN